MFGAEIHKKHSGPECLEFALEQVRQDGNLIRMKVNSITDAENLLLNGTLWPGVFDVNNWFRESTHRPSIRDLGEDYDGYGGTDRVVRTYNNELWEDHGRTLVVVVTEEHGELSAEFKVDW